MLRLEGLTKRYGQTQALDGLSFDVAPGQVFGFVGPNGAGKTTAMRIVIGVLAADSGAVVWNGVPMDESARRRIGYMPEERGLYPKMRVAEQLTYLAELHGADRASAQKGVKRWADELGIAERGDDRVEELSLGNQQRVQLAAALAHEPELLILDEPFSGLDPVGVDVLSEALLAEARDREVPVVFSSHQLELVERLCDAVAIVKDGKLVASGTVAELRERDTQRRYMAELAGEDDWTSSLAGVSSLGDGRFELADDVDPQALLDEARARGPVERFGRDTPTLAELFRDVISENEA